MTRRTLLQAAALALPLRVDRLAVPVLRLNDKYSRATAEQRTQFATDVWLPAVKAFARSGIDLQISEREGEVLKHPSGKPSFRGAERGIINIVITDRIPLDWDMGRSVSGATSIYEGRCVCVISLDEAHGNQIPFFSVNTVIHELLHALLGDIFNSRTGAINGQSRESRIDYLATRLWLFGDGSAVRPPARATLAHLARNF